MKPPPARPGLRLLVINAILFGAVVSLFLFTQTYWSNFFSGPYAVDDQYLLSSGTDASSGTLIRYVELENRTLIDSGWQGTMERDGKPLYSDKFFVMPVEDQFMLVMANSPADGRKLTGPLYRIGSPVEDEVLRSVQAEHPEWKGKLLPTMINGKAAFKVIGYIGLGFLLPVLLVAAVNCVRGVLKLMGAGNDD